jgi:hypothetical protein
VPSEAPEEERVSPLLGDIRRSRSERTKIFAKIEWKDTSKNPTGSKNNSLSE